MIESLEEFFNFLEYENWRPLIFILGILFYGGVLTFLFLKVWNFILELEKEYQPEVSHQKMTEEQKGKVIAKVVIAIVMAMFLAIIILQIGPLE